MYEVEHYVLKLFEFQLILFELINCIRNYCLHFTYKAWQDNDTANCLGVRGSGKIGVRGRNP